VRYEWRLHFHLCFQKVSLLPLPKHPLCSLSLSLFYWLSLFSCAFVEFNVAQLQILKMVALTCQTNLFTVRKGMLFLMWHYFWWWENEEAYTVQPSYVTKLSLFYSQRMEKRYLSYKNERCALKTSEGFGSIGYTALTFNTDTGISVFYLMCYQ
jgi:hypothetical protein